MRGVRGSPDYTRTRILPARIIRVQALSSIIRDKVEESAVGILRPMLGVDPVDNFYKYLSEVAHNISIE